MTVAVVPAPAPTLGDLAVSLVRTGVTVLAGVLVSWAVRHGLNLDQQSVTGWLTPIAIAGYYAVVRVAETYVPALGWLLGMAKPPKYTPPVVPAPAPVTTITNVPPVIPTVGPGG